MPISDATALDAAFKRNYNAGSEVMKQQQNLKAKLFDMFPISPLKPSAQGIFNPVVVQGNETGGAINEQEGFADTEPVVPIQPSITSKLIVWPWQITGTVMDLSETDKVAFARGLDLTMEDNIGRAMSDRNRMSVGTGTGQITLANGAGAASTSLIVDDPFPFRQGMFIDAWTALAGTKQIIGIEVTGINLSTSTLTLASAQTWSDNAIICKREKLDGVTSATNAKEMMGFRGIADTNEFSTTFQGQSATTYTIWRGNVVGAGTAPVSQDLLQRAYNRTGIVGGEKPDTLISNYGQARTYLNTQLTQTRYEPGKVTGGNVELKWGTMTWMVDFTYPLNEVGFLVKNGIEVFQVREMALSQLNGNRYYQIVGRDAIGGYYRWRGNMGTWKRNNQTRLTELTEPTF